MGKHSVVVKRERLRGPASLDLRIGLAAGQAISAATRRRSARVLGAAAGGLLGVAFMPTAAAFADNYTIDPTGTETITGIFGYGYDGVDTASPATPGSIQGHQAFTYADTTSSTTGNFHGFESNASDAFGDTNQEVLVTSSTGTDALPVGSVFDTYTLGDSGYANIYSAIPTGGGNYEITDTVVTPEGDYAMPTTFNAADLTAADAGGVPIGTTGDVIDPVGSQLIDAITGIAPLAMADDGTQVFDVENASGGVIGSFNAYDTITGDFFGSYTEAALVTNDLGTVANDPGVGSIFNTMYYLGGESAYSDVTSPSGNVITDTIITPFGNFDIPTTFDAAQVETTSAIDLPGGDDLHPVGALDFTGVNGLPPVDAAVQGTQTFDYANADGTTGSFGADVTNTLDEFDDSTETVLVTSGSDPDAPIGSVFETVVFGDTGIESIYTDIPSATGGANVITDILQTPFGDLTVPTSLDAIAGVVNDLLSAASG
ncbi:hypothetical protein [Mycobacterium sp.]|uniref:hypothetical protein n=1 Tax=Mycobacterium sp. TaxID=1785 RepID=UPI003BB08B97